MHAFIVDSIIDPLNVKLRPSDSLKEEEAVGQHRVEQREDEVRRSQ